MCVSVGGAVARLVQYCGRFKSSGSFATLMAMRRASSHEREELVGNIGIWIIRLLAPCAKRAV